MQLFFGCSSRHVFIKEKQIVKYNNNMIFTFHFCILFCVIVLVSYGNRSTYRQRSVLKCCVFLSKFNYKSNRKQLKKNRFIICKAVFLKFVYSANTVDERKRLNQSINILYISMNNNTTHIYIYNLPVMQRLNSDRANGNKHIIKTASIFVDWIKMYQPGYDSILVNV